MNAIEVLSQDHRKVEQLYRQYQQAPTNERKGEVVNEIIRELSVHASIEEEVLYPGVREALPDGDQLAQDSLQEHQSAKEILADLDKMSSDDPQFDHKVGQLMGDFEHHVQDEEGEMFPKLQQALGDDVLSDIGQELEQARKRAPTRPHPAAPDQPPGIKVAGPVAALMDRVRDKVQGRG